MAIGMNCTESSTSNSFSVICISIVPATESVPGNDRIVTLSRTVFDITVKQAFKLDVIGFSTFCEEYNYV
jgi:hypothetical protein